MITGVVVFASAEVERGYSQAIQQCFEPDLVEVWSDFALSRTGSMLLLASGDTRVQAVASKMAAVDSSSEARQAFRVLVVLMQMPGEGELEEHRHFAAV